MTDVDHVIAFVRSLEKDHKPDGWPAIQMSEVSVLVDEIERLRNDLESTDRTVCEHFNQPDKCDQCNDKYLIRLRDEFAKIAMQAIVSNIDNSEMAYTAVARVSWSAADTMMKERRNTHD